jgi:hypothetical protein
VAACTPSAQRVAIMKSMQSNAIDQIITEVLDGAAGEYEDAHSQSSAEFGQPLPDNKATGHVTFVDARINVATRRDKKEELASHVQT